jgi:chromosome segregation ATPase
MEAAVAEKEAGMTEWNDGRLDDWSDRVDRIEKKIDAGFGQADQKVEAGFARLDDKFKGIDDKFKEMDQKMDAGFARIDAKFDAFFLHMDAKFDVVNERFEDMHRMLFRSAWALVIGLLGMLSVLIGVIATQS